MPTTTSYNRGAVVLLPFPFSDLTAAKLRPAVVANPRYPSDDLIVVAVSSLAGALRPGEFAIQFWREAGLLHPSFVKRAVSSVSASLVAKMLGTLAVCGYGCGYKSHALARPTDRGKRRNNEGEPSVSQV